MVYREFAEQLAKQPESGRYQLTSAGCLGSCGGDGATVFIHPDGTLYGGVTPADVPEIVALHLRGGSPVARLVVAG